MAKKQTESKIVSEIKKGMEEGSLTIGTDKTMKSLKLGKLSKVFVTSNCSDIVKEDISHYAKLSESEIVELDFPNDELGLICKKPFSISILGLLKGV